MQTPRTFVCVPIMVREIGDSLADAALAKRGGADLVEFRIDGYFAGPADAGGPGAAVSRSPADAIEVARLRRLVAESPLPCILTCRSQEEGGELDGDEAERVSLLEALTAAADHPPTYLDFEFSAYSRSANIRQKVNLCVSHPHRARPASTSLILSGHDFDGRPADLSRRMVAMATEPACAAVKIAFRARSIRDNLELFDLLRERAKPMIALAMGEFGLMSRVLAPKFGGLLTFASLRDSSATAPGQPTLADLLGLYRFRSIGPATRVFGIVGWPVAHSLSPAVHNAGFGAAGFDGVYLPMPVPPEWEHFKATVGAIIDHPHLDLAGLSVTMPHKEHLVRFARERAAEGDESWEIDALAERSAAANTLIIDRQPGGRAARGRIMNTDAAAARECLADVLGDLRDVPTAIVGAGGAARSIAAGLVDAGAAVVVMSRSRERAGAMVDELLRAAAPGESGTIRAGEATADELAACRALVNCTPVGMEGGGDPRGTPVPEESLRALGRNLGAAGVVMDTVYRPRETPLLKAARGLGQSTIDGVAMFVRQASEQFEAWTGAAPPAGLFERVIAELHAGERS